MNGKWAHQVDDFENKYILWCPTSPERPQVVFDDRPAAIKTAYSMAAKFKGEKFFVCKLVGMAQTAQVKFESFSDD